MSPWLSPAIGASLDKVSPSTFYKKYTNAGMSQGDSAGGEQMYVLGLMGSPRRKGIRIFSLMPFLRAPNAKGQRRSRSTWPPNISRPARGAISARSKGIVASSMMTWGRLYHLLRRADVVILATPIFFYGPSAQLKAVIDRAQALWARRYILKLTDPKAPFRKGFLLAVGATKGKELFTGTSLTAKYFFDAVSARYEGFLGFRQIEEPGGYCPPPERPGRRGSEGRGACTGRWPAVGASCSCAARTPAAVRWQRPFCSIYGGDRFDAQSAGDQPAQEINPLVIEAMAERGIDLAFRRPRGMDQIEDGGRPFDLVVQMGCEQSCPLTPSGRVENWELAGPGRQALGIRARHPGRDREEGQSPYRGGKIIGDPLNDIMRTLR